MTDTETLLQKYHAALAAVETHNALGETSEVDRLTEELRVLQRELLAQGVSPSALRGATTQDTGGGTVPTNPK